MPKLTALADFNNASTGPGGRSPRLQHVYPCLVLFLVSLPVLTLRLDRVPAVWFDEGYKMNAAWTLAERGVYGTYTIDGYLPFDPGISSGPMDVALIALSFKTLGPGVVSARLPFVLYTALGLLCLYGIMAEAYGPTSGLFACLVLLAMPTIDGISFLFVGRQGLGEAPALALVALGLWLWFRSWKNDSWKLTLLAGAALGLGLLSKMQMGIPFIPALMIVLLARGYQHRASLGKNLVLFVTLVGVLAGWSLLGQLGTPEAIRQENGRLLWDAIQTNLLTGLWGRTLSRSSLGLLGLMLASVLLSGWRLCQGWRRTKAISDAQWIEILLTLLVAFYGVWFAWLSVGWPRYAYMGLVVSLLLLGRSGWLLLQQLQVPLKSRWPRLARLGLLAAWALLIGLTWITQLLPILQSKSVNTAEQMAEFIQTTVPGDAVVESWEWELDALSSHWAVHHPPQQYLFLAIRQFSHWREPFNLDYDLLQANPDYLVTGVFSDWTVIYAKEAVQANFIQLAEFGPYKLYKRVRGSP